MQIEIIGRHLTVDQATRSYAEEKAARLPHFYDRVKSAEVIIETVTSHGYRVEVVAHADGHEPFVATVEHDQQNGAIDLAIDKIVRQLHDYKQRRRDDKKHPRNTAKSIS